MTTQRRILVTGGATGIGAATVRRLAEDGFDLRIAYGESADAARALAETIAAQCGVSALATRCNLAEPTDVEALCAEIADDGPYFGYVANAALTYDQLSALVNPEQLRRLFAVNVFSAIRIYQSMSRTMTRAKEGRIVFVTSVAVARGGRGNASYAATKGALEAFMRSVVDEVARKDVTINCVAPGYVDTRIMAKYAEHRNSLLTRVPARRFGRPEEVAAVISFLMSRGASFVNGAVIPVDGGASCVMG